MSSRSDSCSSRRAQRGVSLLESLVAVAVLAASTVAVGELHRQLRLGGDIARERSEALRLGTEELERLRAFAAVDAGAAARTFAAIGNDDATIDTTADRSGNTTYRKTRRVDDTAVTGAKSVAVALQWNDRSGAPHEVTLQSFIAGAAPRYVGALGLGAGAVDAAPRGALGRRPFVPPTAKDLGTGRSAWKPLEGGATALIFDNASAVVVGRCDALDRSTRTRDLSAAALAGCATGRWLLIGGTVRFTSGTPPLPSTAGEMPLATTLAIALGAGRYPEAPACFSENQKTVRYEVGGSLQIEAVALGATPESRGLARWEDTGERFVAWHCLVAPRADGRWSGRASLVATGWAIGTGRDDHRVCRYVGGAGAAAIDANIAHPADYVDVDAALVAQNFLVVRGSESCPVAGTVQHQP